MVTASTIRIDAHATDPIDLLNDGANRHLRRAAPLRFDRLSTVVDIHSSQRLRADISIANGWAEETDFPEGRDIDSYDPLAIHIGGMHGSHLVATGRLIFSESDRLLPTEQDFNIRVPYPENSVDVGRVIVTQGVSDASSTVLLALIGTMWHHADGRTDWIGTNSAAVIRHYRKLGAIPQLLGPAKLHLGEWRYPVLWQMRQFADPYWRLSHL